MHRRLGATTKGFLSGGLAIALLAGSAAAAPASRPVSRARPTAPSVSRLEVVPSALRMYGRDARDRVYVTAVLSDGSRKDVTAGARFRALGPQVEAGPGGALRAVRNGETRVAVRYGGKETALPVTVSRAERREPVSFRYDVLPVLSRAGCNQGTCHGNSEGRGGLKLSLKGEDPESDYHILANHGGGRRLNRMEPGRSLLLLKATSTLPHGGGRRFAPESDEYRLVAGWIAEGARFDGTSSETAPLLTRLEVKPAERVLTAPARMLRLEAVGHFSDGSVRNVSQKAIFSSGEPLIEVTPDGMVRSDRGGDTAVLVRYAEQMVNARVTFIPARRAFAWKPVPEHNWIDAVNFRRLRALRLVPSELCSDEEFLRRAYLDAIGTLPTPDEVKAFLAECEAERRDRRSGSHAPAARARLIERLLQRPEFDEFWAMKWADILRVEERSLDPKGATAYRDWIRTSIATEKPLDRFARELLLAGGSTYANPPANYYRRTRTPDELAENTAQVFMGTRLLCAKCHNHPFERWKQDDYYALAAVFAPITRKGELTRRDRFDLNELIGEETIGLGRGGKVEHPRTGKPVPPRLPFQSAALEGADPRVPFVEWLTSPQNPLFARAMANRIWYHLMGRGIVDPVDDLRESNPPSNPELLDALAKELVENGFRLRPLVRLIMNSRTYQLSSEPNATNADDERFFSRSIVQRLPAEVLLDAMSDVTGVPETFTGFPEGTRAIQLYTLNKRPVQFLKLFGQPQRESVCECERSTETTLGQSFALISGEALHAKLRAPENRIGKRMAEGRSDAEIVTELYQAALCREPSPKELEAALAYRRSRPDRREALEDLLWALLNSKEFLLRR